MPSLFNPTHLQHLCQKHGLKPSKKYGQNFLIDESVIDATIAAAHLSKNDVVIEVGPGFGTLTLALAPHVKKVIAFEIEKKLQLYWESGIRNQESGNIEIVWGNVLASLRGGGRNNRRRGNPLESRTNSAGSINSESKRIPTASFVGLGMTPLGEYKVVANLPYQITSPVVRLFLESQNPPTEMILMVQKEVAERICAKPGTMSLLSVAVQYYADPEVIQIVPRTSFWPVPGVDSAIIKLSLRGGVRTTTKQPPGQDDNFVSKMSSKMSGDRHVVPMRIGTPRDDTAFFKIVKAGFAQRRKLLIKNLKPIIAKKNGKALEEAFAAIGLPLKIRAQELSVNQWTTLAKALDI